MSNRSSEIFPPPAAPPSWGELELLGLLWEAETRGAKALRLSEVHERMARRRVGAGYPEPALTTVSTQLRSLLKKGWLEEVQVTLADQPVVPTPLGVRGNRARSSRSPLTGYCSKFRPLQVLEPTFRELAGLVPAAQRPQALLEFAAALELTPKTIKALERLLNEK